MTAGCKTDLTWYFWVFKNHHRQIILALQAPQYDTQIEAAWKNEIFLLLLVLVLTQIIPADIYDILGVLSKLKGWYALEQLEIGNNLSTILPAKALLFLLLMIWLRKIYSLILKFH